LFLERTMNKGLLFVLCAVVGVGICTPVNSKCSNLHPVILMPGIMGTSLHANADIPPTVDLPVHCPRQLTDQLVWIDLKELFHYSCLKDYFQETFNPKTGEWDPTPGIEFIIPKWPSVYAVDKLAPGSIVSFFVDYYHKLIEKFKSYGYVDEETIFGAGFDWKKAPSDKWVNDVKNLVEHAYEINNGTKVVLITHSMGGPVSYYFLMQQTPEWIQKYLHMYIPIAPAWMGASKAFDYMLMGVDLNLPISGKGFAPLMRHLPGVWFLLPYAEAFPNMTLATSPSKNYTFDMLEELLNDGNMSFVEGKLKASRGMYEKINNFERFPGIPVREFMGHGKKTVQGLHFKEDIKPHDPDGEWEAATQIIGDGDETVPYNSLRYAADKWKNAGYDVELYEFDTTHMGILSDSTVMQKIVDLVCDT